MWAIAILLGLILTAVLAALFGFAMLGAWVDSLNDPPIK
jgi:hypothetical protein